jgi:hypothetical protein
MQKQQRSLNPNPLATNPNYYCVYDYFDYSITPFLALAAAGGTGGGAGAPASNQAQIQMDSDFEMTHVFAHVDSAGAQFNIGNMPMANATIVITDTGSGRQLSNNPVPIDCICSNVGSNIIPLPQPKIFTGGSTIQVQLQSFDAAATPNIRIVLKGRKIFYFPIPQN